MQTLLQWLKERIVYVLLTIIVFLSGTVAWLGFRPDEADFEWRAVNQQMEQALQSTDAKPQNDVKASPPVTEKSKNDAEPVWPIDLNKATLEQLDKLPGIGPSKAQAIIDLRSRLGQFTSTDQLLDVKGIGPKTYDKFRDKVTVTK